MWRAVDVVWKVTFSSARLVFLGGLIDRYTLDEETRDVLRKSSLIGTEIVLEE